MSGRPSDATRAGPLEVSFTFQPGNGRNNGCRPVDQDRNVEPGNMPRISRLTALAIRFEGLVRRGDLRDYADLARLGCVTRARITQIMNLLHLAPDIQVRRSSVNARPRGATSSGSCRFCRVHKRLCCLLPLSADSLFRSVPPGVRAQPWGLRPLSRDISSGFSDSLFFPSALFNSPVGLATCSENCSPSTIPNCACPHRPPRGLPPWAVPASSGAC